LTNLLNQTDAALTTVQKELKDCKAHKDTLKEEHNNAVETLKKAHAKDLSKWCIEVQTELDKMNTALVRCANSNTTCQENLASMFLNKKDAAFKAWMLRTFDNNDDHSGDDLLSESCQRLVFPCLVVILGVRRYVLQCMKPNPRKNLVKMLTYHKMPIRDSHTSEEFFLLRDDGPTFVNKLLTKLKPIIRTISRFIFPAPNQIMPPYKEFEMVVMRALTEWFTTAESLIRPDQMWLLLSKTQMMWLVIDYAAQVMWEIEVKKTCQ
jgi:hypothetical protein